MQIFLSSELYFDGQKGEKTIKSEISTSNMARYVSTTKLQNLLGMSIFCIQEE